LLEMILQIIKTGVTRQYEAQPIYVNKSLDRIMAASLKP
jgi:hypothetical protein